MLWRWKWLAGLTVTGCVPGTQSAPIGINVSLFLCFIRVTLEKQGRLVSLAFLSPECLPGLATFMRSGRTWKGESHVPKLLGILRARQQRGRRSAGQFWAGARALARSQACTVNLGTRLSLHWVFSRPLSGLGELVLGSPVGLGECTRARSLWGSNSGSRTCSYITHLSKAGSSIGNGSNDAWAMEGPGEGRMRRELGRATPTPSPEDAQVGRCHNVFLALEPLPGLQALWLQWSYVPLEGPLRARPQHLCQRVKRPQNGQNPRSHRFYWTTQNELDRNTQWCWPFTKSEKANWLKLVAMIRCIPFPLLLHVMPRFLCTVYGPQVTVPILSIWSVFFSIKFSDFPANEKCKSKLQGDNTSHRSERPSSKNPQTTHAGEGLVRRDPSCISGNVNWCSHNMEAP